MGLAAIDMSKGCSGQFVKPEDLFPEQREQVIALYIELMKYENQFSDPELHYDDEDFALAEEFLITISDLYILTNFGTGRIIGFLAMDYGNPNEIASLFIVEECRSTGFGSLMVMSVINRDPYNGVSVFCYDDNKRALKFYESLGFVFTGNEDCPGVLNGIREGKPIGVVH